MIAELAIRNGTIFDARDGTFSRGDVFVSDGRIIGIETGPSEADAVETIDAGGAVVAPGLVDMHTHIFCGQDLGVDAAEIGPRAGTTTFVDTGSAGAHLWGAFHAVVARLPQRVLAFINISTVGTTSIRLQGELFTGRYIDHDACVAAARSDHRAVGVKVRASRDVASTNADPALRAARAAADELGLPLMVHLGPAPSDVETILGELRQGDILTHCFTAFAENGLLDGTGLRRAVVEARERGVLFDVGHGASGFDSTSARSAVELGFLPDTISSDLHTYSVDHVVDLPTVLTRFVALGVSVADVLSRATYAPAAALGLTGDGVGHLRVGGVADIAVLRIANEPVEFVDANGTAFSGRQRVVVDTTIQGGTVLYRRTGATS